MVSSTPGATPFRDQLNINQEPGSEGLNIFVKDALRKQLQSLPSPRNDFELVLPEDEADNEAKMVEGDEDWVEDAEEMDSHKKQLAERRAALDRLKRSQPVQRSLPIPSRVNEQYKKKTGAKTATALVSHGCFSATLHR